MSESRDERMERIADELDRVLPSPGSCKWDFRKRAYLHIFRFEGVEHTLFADSSDDAMLQMAKICGIDVGDESDGDA